MTKPHIDTGYRCPECNGKIDVNYENKTIVHRCQQCKKIFGVNTDKPIFVSTYRKLKPEEIKEILNL